VNELLKQMAEERAINNRIIHALRTETVSLSKLLEKQKKENVIELERREALISENTEKKKIIHEKVCYIAEQARIAKNTKIEAENRAKEFKEEKKNLLQYILQQNEITNDLSMVILSMRAVVRTSNSYVLPYLYTPGKDYEKVHSQGKSSEMVEYENERKTALSHDVSEKGHFLVPENAEDKGTRKMSKNDNGGTGMSYNGTEETKSDCEEQKEKEEELLEELRGEREAEKEEGERNGVALNLDTSRDRDRVSENTRKSSS
jgi:hypothetical protein